MTSASIQVTSQPSTRELVKRVLAAKEGVTQDRREMLRGQGRRFVQYAQEEAPKRTGEFASKIAYRTFVSGDTDELRVYTQQPLGKWILEGTRPHVIRAKNAPILRFYWHKVGRVVYFKSVNHPGTKPNPFMSRAYRRWLPGARGDLRQVAVNWSRRIQGAAVNPKSLSA